MEIHVVEPGDSINSIADKYGISVEKLISDNGLLNALALVPGQAIVILYPQKTYSVKAGDTLGTIADSNGISIMQLFRNNPFLYDRKYIYPGESLVINYNTEKELQVNGFAYAFINRDILKRSLPYLTYLSIFNYRIGENVNIINYGDDIDIINIAKDYQTIPLLMLSAFSPTGELNLDYVYDLLQSEEKQNKLVNDMLEIVRSKGFFGINALISHMNESNQSLYLHVLTKLSKALRNEGYIFMLTINPNLQKTGDTFVYEKLDYRSISSIVDRIIFLRYVWGKNYDPPGPVSNISLIRPFMNYITTIISPEIISIGKPIIGYDWSLPFVPDSTYANSMTLNTAITLAYEQQAVIYLDEESQTPYFNYVRPLVGAPEQHIVWFIDARSIDALNDVIVELDLVGSGIWSISVYNQQMWSVINARFSIIKLPIQ